MKLKIEISDEDAMYIGRFIDLANLGEDTHGRLIIKRRLSRT
jgi:hypothetical protein